ncbi:MAG: cytochrome b/b6 domain-containing protein [Thiotrichales bacterium]
MHYRSIRIWDLPTRVFHWLLLALVIGSIVSVKIGGNAMLWHGRFGQSILGLIVFRLLWGFVGSTYARFAQFVRGPHAIRAYLAGRWQGLGHTPLGALSVLALLGVIGFQAVSGLFANDDIAFHGPLYRAVSESVSNRISGWHRNAEWLIYALVALHVLAILYYAIVKKVELVKPMITGVKRVAADGEPARGGSVLALIGALAAAAFTLWVASGGLLPTPVPVPPAPDLGW